MKIIAPSPGEALQGNVPIQVQTAIDGFQSAELSFSYASDLTSSWFQIARSSQPISEGELIEWDTTSLTDGNYILRLTVFLVDEEPIIDEVPDLRIRNYTPIETSTPTPTDLPSTQGLGTPPSPPSATPPPPTPTRLPPNPAQVAPDDIMQSLSQGMFATVIGFSLIGLLLALRTLMRR